LATRTKGGVWNQKDTPMLLHLFEYVVRKSLLNWWQDMANRHAGDREKEKTLMQQFQDDDAGYFAWLTAHPKGFVVNCYRHPTPSYLVLHRTTCSHIRRNRSTLTGSDYRKVCSEVEQNLHDWATTLGGSLIRCRSCQP
jgi:hypothetical protein